MKRLFSIVLLVLLAVACSSDPQTPGGTDEGPTYPDVAAIWTDSSATARACGQTMNADVEINISQNEDTLNGSLTLVLPDAGQVVYDFDGSISTSGEVDGTAERTDSPDLDVDLTLANDQLSGTLTEQVMGTCPDGSQDRVTIDVSLR